MVHMKLFQGKLRFHGAVQHFPEGEGVQFLWESLELVIFKGGQVSFGCSHMQ